MDSTKEYWTDDSDQVEDSSYVEPSHSKRESDIFRKRRFVKPITESESESETSYSQSLLHRQNNNTKPVIESDSEDESAERSIENGVSKPVIESDSEDESAERSIENGVSEPEIDSEEDESHTEQNDAVTRRIGSVIEDSQISENIEASKEAEASSSDSGSLHSLYDHSFEEEVEALSTHITRLSSEFNLGKTGVFNSTAEPTNKNTTGSRSSSVTPSARVVENTDKEFSNTNSENKTPSGKIQGVFNNTAEPTNENTTGSRSSSVTPSVMVMENTIKEFSNTNSENKAPSGKIQLEQMTPKKQNELDSVETFGTTTNHNKQTPQNFVQRRNSPDSTDVDEVESDNDVIEVSTSEEETPPKTPLRSGNAAVLRQRKLHELLSAKKATSVSKPTPLESLKTILQTEEIKPNVVSRTEYEAKKTKVQKMGSQVMQLAQMMKTINMGALPDNGQSLKDRHKTLEIMYRRETDELNSMVVTREDQPLKEKNAAVVAWEDIQAGAGGVLPKTFGARAMSTYNAQKAVTMERLHQLHSSLETCPKESQLENDPRGMKVELMHHQRQALAWLMWREAQKPSGGILADDMGLGKTLTMISLIIKMMDIEKGDNSDNDDDQENQPDKKQGKINGGTLIVCPASLLEQWSGEIDRRLKRGRVSYTLFHGPKREIKPKRLADHDIVITTYAVVNVESNKNGVLYKIKWRRIILDEAHHIRNHRAQTSDAAYRLSAKSRWALTGTPIHNKELDMYSLMKFLRCSPFDDLSVWKTWVGNKSCGGTERLHTVISSLMLRRTKVELIAQGSLQSMPERKWDLISVKLGTEEMKIYEKVLVFSKTLFTQFLHQRAQKNQDIADIRQPTLSKPNEEYFKMRSKLLKLNKVKEISQHEILVLLLRLRQICNHPSLIKNMLDSEEQDLGEEDEKADHLNLLEQLRNLNLDGDDDEHDPDFTVEGIAQDKPVSLKTATKGIFNPSNPVFDPNFKSTKIKHVLEVIKEQVLSRNDKAVVVSQWPSYLQLIAKNLKDEKIKYELLDGKVPVPKRMEMVDTFNNPNSKVKIMLLSLTAGGVGLNLIGGNHLVLLDLHWNPQLESQAQDRIYRMGQQKPVFVYKFMAVNTIEEGIKELQDKKKNIAEGMLNGTKEVTQNKLSIQDLARLFNM